VILGTDRQVVIHRQMGQEVANLGFAHLRWVAFVVQQNEARDPIAYASSVRML
jgi:hypothetical protein